MSADGLSAAVKGPRPALPSAVVAALRRPGVGLGVEERRVHEERLGRAFGDVRVHLGAAARRSADELDAVAYTVGRHVVLGGAAERLGGEPRQRLLAHELAHVVQQRHVADSALGRAAVGGRDTAGEHAAHRAMRGGARAVGAQPTVGGPTVQRLSFVRDVIGLFASDDYDDATLQEYLRTIARLGGPEGHSDSDNRARALVRRWVTGSSPFVLTAQVVGYLVVEMLEGATMDGDELAILELLERSDGSTLRYLFTTGGLTANGLLDDFHGEEEHRLRALVERRFTGGFAALAAGRVAPRGRPVPLGVPLGEEDRVAAMDAPRPGERLPTAVCSISQPGNCTSYEEWVATFEDLPVFDWRTGEPVDPAAPGAPRTTVIGERAAPDATATDPRAAESERRPTLLHENRDFRPEDRFIHGPTDEWVRRTLPPTLRTVAYRLPSDCADIAVILRHVWLVAQGRSERYQGWDIGSNLGEARSEHMRRVITDTAHSGNVARLVRPYTGGDGRPLRSWTDLANRVHVGDVLVWSHTRTGGGHTHTVSGVRRDPGSGVVTRLDVLQGNQPIGAAEAAGIVANDHPAGATVDSLRRAPGRRIERSRLTIANDDLRDVGGVWTWGDGQTQLVAAGPPVSAGGPDEAPGPGATSGFAGWRPVLAAAPSTDALLSQFEAALLDVRGLVEAGQPAAGQDGAAFGTAAGARLWALAKAEGAARRRAAARGDRPENLRDEDLGASSQFRPLQQMLGLLRGLAARSRVLAVATAFDDVGRTLEFAARGMGADLEFARPDSVHVLVTGFDPFGRDHPGPGRFNPTGAAAVALDGQRVDVGPRTADIEGVVLPVDYTAFRGGMVERLVGPLVSEVDAVITLSLDASIAANGPLDLERLTVGVHRLLDGRYERVSGVPGAGGDPGSPGPVLTPAQGADALLGRARTAPGPMRLGAGEVSEDWQLELRFPTAADADTALEALGLVPQHGERVTIDSPAAVQRIMASAAAGVGDNGIRWTVGSRAFSARLEGGPGGSFLSNEVSYRVLRRLASTPGAADVTSFHLHTPHGLEAADADIPELDGSAARVQERRTALGQARANVDRIVSVVRKVVAAVVRRPR